MASLELRVHGHLAESVKEQIQSRFEGLRTISEASGETVLDLDDLDAAAQRALLSLLWDFGHDIAGIRRTKMETSTSSYPRSTRNPSVGASPWRIESSSSPGPWPVGVRTIALGAGADTVAEYTAEIWYPADAGLNEAYGSALDTFVYADKLPAASQHAIRDAEAAEGRRPTIAYWHGGYGHRREMAATCVFLASHGYVVVAPDFPGDHIALMYTDDPTIKDRPVDESAAARPQQAADVLDAIDASPDSFLKSVVDVSRIGSFGLSLGGFTALAVNSCSHRPSATVAIAPACGTRSPIPAIARLRHLLRLDNWKSDSATFLLTGSADALVIVDDVRELYEGIPSPKHMLVLKDAGHLHWADNAEQSHEQLRRDYLSGQFPDPELDGPAIGRAFRPFSELCPADHAVQTMRTICLAHFTGVLQGDLEAQEFLSDGLAASFEAQGIAVE